MSKVWFITGSSRGFGRSLAEAVLKHGDKLVATARKPKQLADLVECYRENICTIELDVTNPEQAKAAIDFAIKTFGRIDVVVNNAGYSNIAAIEETSFEDFYAQIETNLWGVINVTKAALPILHKQRSGHFIQFSSIGGRCCSPGLAPYQASKFAVEGFSEVLSKEIAPIGLKVTLIEPGGFRTDWGGSSMKVVEPGDDYKETVGSILTYIRQNTGKEIGDPDKAALAIIKIVDEENPPLRLLLGSDAVNLANATDQAKLDETKRWASLSISTDFDAIQQ
ncbi:short-chain dehydrogenase/reductase [Bacillus cereus]|uniref:Short-chain dehydrogenase/reductase n=2 Tax=Bacillus cereus TaxID=1396 RepID=A0A9X6UDR6_BACCE|nr:short-chain dehydrogenase/reductase [Bacillus cereus]